MGDDAARPQRPAKTLDRVTIRVRPDAHIDVADLHIGSVSKTTPVTIDADTARALLLAHPYLEATEG